MEEPLMQNQYKMNRILTLGVLFSLLFGTYRTACASQSLPTYDLGETVVTVLCQILGC